MSKQLEREALKYDLISLIKLQDKRKENILLFEASIKGEREATQQEETVQSVLETKLRQHDLGLSKLDETDKVLILEDIPKLKSTREKRSQTIMLLKAAIIAEQESMDYEENMIMFLEKKNGSQV